MSDLIAEATIAEWCRNGPQAVENGAAAVTITDRSPCYEKDRISPEGAWGWQYGWRWLSEDMQCARWTLPEDVFRMLPECPYPEAREGLMPRWPTEEDAVRALNTAAYVWASECSRMARRSRNG